MPHYLLLKLQSSMRRSLLEVRSRVVRAGFYSGAAGILLLLPMSWLTVWAVRRSLNPLHDLAARAGQISVRQMVFGRPCERARHS